MNDNNSNNNKDPNKNRNRQTALILAVAGFVAFTVLTFFTNLLNPKQSTEISYTKFMQMVEAGEAKRVVLKEDQIVITPNTTEKGGERVTYYTGIIFSAFTYGTGEPIAKGGRYDQLLAHFGTPYPAVGVGVDIDQLMSARIRQGLILKEEMS